MQQQHVDWVELNKDSLELLCNGTYALKEHRCASCGTVRKPQQQQYHFDGLVASTECSCGKSVVTLMGEPTFMQYAMEEFKVA